MATKRKKSNTKWYLSSRSQPVLAVIAVAVFSVIGALYLQASQAANPVFTKTADWQSMYAYAGPGSSLKLPFTINETVDTSNPRQVPSGQIVYKLPPTKNSSPLAQSVSVKFHAAPIEKTFSPVRLQVCALVRREKPATKAEPMTIETSASPNSTRGSDRQIYQLAGSTSYSWKCGATIDLRTVGSTGFDVSTRIWNGNVSSNARSEHPLHLAFIKLSYYTPPTL